MIPLVSTNVNRFPKVFSSFFEIFLFENIFEKVLTIKNLSGKIFSFAGVAEWQTRRLQVPVVARLCGFKSHLLHEGLRELSETFSSKNRIPNGYS